MFGQLKRMTFSFFKRRRTLLAAIDTLNTNITALNETITKAVADLQARSGATEAQVQAAADAVAQANSTLAAALPPA